MRYLGIDTKRVVRKGALTSGKDFNALFGVGVSVNDLDKFYIGYARTIQSIFEKANMEVRRPVYKAKDLNQLFYPKSIDHLELFIEGISPYIDALDIFYGYLDETKQVNVYYAEPLKKSTISAIDFIDLVEESYPAYCAWELISKLNGRLDCVVFTDNFKIRQCRVWNELNRYPHLKIVPWGDRCNPLISTADILAAAIDARLRKRNVRFKSATDVLPEFGTKLVLNPSTSLLYALSPARDEPAPIEDKISRPTVYIFKSDPGEFKRLFPTVNQKDMIIDSVHGDCLIRESARLRLSLKFYESSDNPKIQKGDKFIHFDDFGFNQIKLLQRFGYNNQVIDANDSNQTFDSR